MKMPEREEPHFHSNESKARAGRTGYDDVKSRFDGHKLVVKDATRVTPKKLIRRRAGAVTTFEYSAATALG
jgi:hypothetical protein